MSIRPRRTFSFARLALQVAPLLTALSCVPDLAHKIPCATNDHCPGSLVCQCGICEDPTMSPGACSTSGGRAGGGSVGGGSSAGGAVGGGSSGGAVAAGGDAGGSVAGGAAGGAVAGGDAGGQVGGGAAGGDVAGGTGGASGGITGGGGGNAGGGTGGTDAGCVPSVCAGRCGNPPDGCGGTLLCGVCVSPTVCTASFICQRADTEAQVRAIQAAASASDGGVLGVSLPLDGVTVTARKPTVPGAAVGDGPGFFVQYGDAGIFVDIDPLTIPLNPPTPGDSVTFTVTRVSRELGMRRVKSLTGYVRLATNVALPASKEFGALDFTNPVVRDSAESTLARIVNPAQSVVGTSFDGGFGPNNGYGNVLFGAGRDLRLPWGLNDTEDLRRGCTVVASQGPIWMEPGPPASSGHAQLLVWQSSALMGTSCPPPNLVTVDATASPTIDLAFDRFMDPSFGTVELFEVGGLQRGTIGSPSRIGPQELRFFASNLNQYWNYELRPGTGQLPRDTRGSPAVFMPRRFSAGGCKTPQGPVLISGAYTTSVFSSGSAIELHNRTNLPVTLGNQVLRVRTNSSLMTIPLGGVTIPAGSYFLITNGAGLNGDFTAPNLNLDEPFSDIVLTEPTGLICGPLGDSLSWGNGGTQCPGPFLPALPQFGGSLVGYRRLDPVACADRDNVSDWQQTSSPQLRGLGTQPIVCACP